MFGFKGGGMDAFIVTSAANADRLIKEFERRIAKGENPNECSDEVFNSLGIDAKMHLTPSDYIRVQNSVERIWRQYH